MAKKKKEAGSASGFSFSEFMAEHNVPTLQKMEKQQERYKTYSTGSFMLDIAIGERDCDTGRPGIPERAIVEVFGINSSCKCFGIGTPLRMYDGTVKMVQDIVVGDRLMGPDGSPRTVTSLASGKQQLYRVIPNRGESWVCNESHILSLKTSGVVTESHRTGEGEKRTTIRSLGDVINITVRDFLKKSEGVQRQHSLYKSGSVTFDTERKPLALDPYFLGVWLGDGSSDCPAITTADSEIREMVYAQAATHLLGVREEAQRNNASITYNLTLGNIGGRTKNPIREALRQLTVLGNKHIPYEYQMAEESDRLQLLAGLIDTDGWLVAAGHSFNITQKSRSLAEQIVFVARSLGFASEVKTRKGGCWYKDEYKEGIYHTVRISGDTERIPTRIVRKQAVAKHKYRNPMVTGFKLEPLGIGDFYGFEVSGPDRLFLLEDFTVVHNTATAENLLKSVLDSDPRALALCIWAEEPDMDRLIGYGIDTKRVASLHAYQKGEGEELEITQHLAEKQLELACTAVQDPNVKLVIIDSIKALCSIKQMYDKDGKPIDMDSAEGLAIRATMLARFIMKFKQCNQKAILFMTNQIADRLGTNYNANPTFNVHTPGGRAKEFECTLRIKTVSSPIWTEKDHGLTNEKLLKGWKISYCIIKNKYSKKTAYRVANAEFYFNPAGFRKTSEIIACADYLGLIEKGGAGYYKIGERKVRGEKNVVKLLEADPELVQSLENDILDKMSMVYDVNEEDDVDDGLS